ncbi:hypothetical protein [Streptomyces odontomachi]|uniref:hypothetical protein n=1 Tax=Streptomyces odontomachi TaxID=2944940 RepID=UPI00210B2BE5|nr:hypothetical protein [Streptomyces sp. ODS25]
MYEEQPSRLPVQTFTWCQWHEGYTATGLMVGAIEQGSGPGMSVYACAPCRQEHDLRPWSETGL